VTPNSVPKKLDVAKCINGKAFKFAQLLRSDALTSDTYECTSVRVCVCVKGTTAWPGAKGNPRLPQEAMNSFICLLAQVATSFCKHFRLHATFFPAPKKPQKQQSEKGGRERGMQKGG